MKSIRNHFVITEATAVESDGEPSGTKLVGARMASAPASTYTEYPPPWGEFRAHVADLIAQAGAPKKLVASMARMAEDEGVAGFGELNNAWAEAWREFRDLRNDAQRFKREFDSRDAWNESISYILHDAIIMMLDDYNNSWNYAPGKGPQPISEDEQVRIAEFVSNAAAKA